MWDKEQINQVERLIAFFCDIWRVNRLVPKLCVIKWLDWVNIEDTGGKESMQKDYDMWEQGKEWWKSKRYSRTKFRKMESQE